jgi:hypothetical protein
MALQTFTAGQILTAAQVTALQANDYNQTVSNKVASYVLVAADKGTRVVMSNAAATTVTVNTSLFTAGDTLYIQNIGAGTCTVTAGTATVTCAGSLALSQWQGGTLYFTSASAAVFFPSDKTLSGQGLTVVKAETPFSASAAVTADAVFTSGYTNYRILMTATAAAGTPALNVTLRASGVAATTNYAWNTLNVTGATLTGSSASAQASWTAGQIQTTTGVSWWMFDLYNPQLAVATQMTTTMAQSATQSWLYWSNNTNATAYDGIGFTPASSTITGSYTIYGYWKAV